MTSSTAHYKSLFEVGEFDPHNREFLADPYTTYHAMRATQPIYYWRRKNAWLLTRYADTRQLLRSENFGTENSNQLQDTGSPTWEELVLSQRGMPNLAQLRNKATSMLTLWFPTRNPPAHTRLRRATDPPLSKHSVTELQEYIQTTADHLLDKVEATGEMDVLADFSFPLVWSGMSKVLGLQFDNVDTLIPLAMDVSNLLDIEPDSKTYERGIFSMMKLLEFFRQRQGLQITNPQGVFNLYDQAEQAGTMSSDERLAHLVMLLTATIDAPPQSIAIATLRLLQNPEQLKLLQSQPDLLKPALDELLRYDPIVSFTVREALCDTTIGGQPIRQGEKVYALLGGANHDPEVYAEPDQVDITRPYIPHLSFGQGIHHCIGAHLGRLELHIALKTILQRFPRLALKDTELKWASTFRNRGLQALHVTF